MNRSGIDTSTVADRSGYAAISGRVSTRAMGSRFPRKSRPAETSRNAAITTQVGWTVDGQLTRG
jgi:hypothetical protein